VSRDNVLIIGAGPSGLALAHALGGGTRILEQAKDVGGLCRSIEMAGAVFDIGGHSFHTPHPDVQDLVEQVMGGHWQTLRRDARVWFGGDLIPYPFQQHFRQLSDAAIVADCESHQPAAAGPVEAADFEDWIGKRFGAGIAEHFMLPYNRKLWARDLKRIGCDWVGERVAGGERGGPEAAARRRPLQSNQEIGYPAEGGFGEIFTRMSRQCGPIEFDRKVVSIDAARKQVTTQDGSSWGWNRLVSTMPVPLLLETLKDCPPALIGAAQRLEYVSLKVVLIAVGEPVSDQPQRVYVADPAVPAHKIAFNHTSSPALRARPSQSIMCEVSYSDEKPIGTDTEITAAMIDWLTASRLIPSRGSVIETRVLDLKYGYPVYTHDRQQIMDDIRGHLAGLEIRTIGRFGAWAYVNSDACIHEGLSLARELRA